MKTTRKKRVLFCEGKPEDDSVFRHISVYRFNRADRTLRHISATSRVISSLAMMLLRILVACHVHIKQLDGLGNNAVVQLNDLAAEIAVVQGLSLIHI